MARIWPWLLILLGLQLSSPGAAQDNEALDIEDLRAFAEAWGRIKSHYVEPIDDRVLLEAAIRGMVSELDQNSRWLNEDEFQRLEDDALGHFGGLGVRIAIQPDHLQVVQTSPNTPADRAGLEPGDHIVEINGQRLDQNDSELLALQLRGSAGSTVELAIDRGRSGPLLRLILTREIIQQTSVFWQALDSEQVLIRLSSFQQTTPSEFDRAVEAILANHSPSGIIVDLRGNPGGMVQSAVAVADRLLDEGSIVSSQGRSDRDDKHYRANPGTVFDQLPIAVLIDNQSASSAEILAGALRDQGRVTIFGERSYGKGSVQSIWPLSNGSAIRLTTARYKTPRGLNLEGAGIIPDIEVPYDPKQQQDMTLVMAQDWLMDQRR